MNGIDFYHVYYWLQMKKEEGAIPSKKETLKKFKCYKKEIVEDAISFFKTIK